jgi:hypothetical protein
MKHLRDLRMLLREDKLFMDMLRITRSLGLKDWSIGAGVIRNIVWSKLHGVDCAVHRDIDVVYFDKDGSVEDETLFERRLYEIRPELPWEVKNQALVHLWYKEKFGFSVEPLTSLQDAISTWPETATCIGAYLDDNEEIQVIAPYGLDDLLNIVLKRNPRRVTEEIFEKRLIQKNMAERWPKMSIIRV